MNRLISLWQLHIAFYAHGLVHDVTGIFPFNEFLVIKGPIESLLNQPANRVMGKWKNRQRAPGRAVLVDLKC